MACGQLIFSLLDSFHVFILSQIWNMHDESRCSWEMMSKRWNVLISSFKAAEINDEIWPYFVSNISCFIFSIFVPWLKIMANFVQILQNIYYQYDPCVTSRHDKCYHLSTSPCCDVLSIQTNHISLQTNHIRKWHSHQQ